MRGQVLEIRTPHPDLAMRALKTAQQQGRVKFEEAALYGAQIHVVVSDAQKDEENLRTLLKDEGIDVTAIERIAPTLEDVFISSVTPVS
jgi:ABC-2 type transport system ATP-binding protein